MSFSDEKSEQKDGVAVPEKIEEDEKTSSSAATGAHYTRYLVAADFCHLAAPRSRTSSSSSTSSSASSSCSSLGSVYVATRYSSSEYKKYQPGFLLAFLSHNFLRRQGFRYWDLGGANLSPMMSYKFVVATPVSWHEKQFRAHQARSIVVGSAVVDEKKEVGEAGETTAMTRTSTSTNIAATTTTTTTEQKHETMMDQMIKSDSFRFDPQFSAFIEEADLTDTRPVAMGKDALGLAYRELFSDIIAKQNVEEMKVGKMKTAKRQKAEQKNDATTAAEGAKNVVDVDRNAAAVQAMQALKSCTARAPGLFVQTKLSQ
ncbi:unnamed protein product [Amoebophrya sp. A25]|nr:unnamed protein product [Amoebophrya sp. A25]|eukprot:GSA25T00018288001.1